MKSLIEMLLQEIGKKIKKIEGEKMASCKICHEETSNSYGVCDTCQDILIRMKLKNKGL